jgi:hypothetical protein
MYDFQCMNVFSTYLLLPISNVASEGEPGTSVKLLRCDHEVMG